MDLTFTCLEVLGMTQECQFWGDTINYRNVQSYTARGLLSGSRNQDSIAPVWSGISGFVNYTTGICNFNYGSGFLGSGKITSLSFLEGTDVQNKQYSIGFQIFKSGDLSQVTGYPYTGITEIYGFLPYLNSFSENFEYQQSNNLTTDFSRNVSFGLDKQWGNQISGAHILGYKVLGALADLGVYTPPPPLHFTGYEGMTKSISQVIDTINGNFSFSESYSFQSGLAWVHEYSHSLNYGEDGITTVSEEGSIQANRRTNAVGDRIDYALSGWNVAKTGIYFRVSGVFDRWSDQFQSVSGCPLDSTPATKNFTKDYSRGLVSYNYSFDNNPAAESGYYNSYEQSISMNDAGWLDVSVNGRMTPRTSLNPDQAFSGLYIQYSGTVRPQIDDYANDAYDGTFSYFQSPACLNPYTGNLALLSSEENYNLIPASISYGFSYTDDPSYISTGIFRKIKNTYSDQQITPLVNIFRIPNYLELPQNSYQSNVGVLTNNIEIIGTESATIDQYKTAASGKIIVPTGTYWMSSNTYSFSPINNQFSMNVEYTYLGHRAINDFIL